MWGEKITAGSNAYQSYNVNLNTRKTALGMKIDQACVVLEPAPLKKTLVLLGDQMTSFI